MRTSPELAPTSRGTRPEPVGAAIASAGSLSRRLHLLREERLGLLRTAAALANASTCRLFWVGGGVRDLWLDREVVDLDLAIDGNLEEYSGRLAAELRAGRVAHPRFLTVELELPDGSRVDLSRLRSERYPAPASLPVVTPGDLASDLARRDFSINAMAIPLAPEFGAEPSDPFDGLEDLRLRRLRILHPASFRDDPTRILRGVELEARLGFRFDDESAAAARAAIRDGFLEKLSGSRLREALWRALGRRSGAVEVVRRLGELGFWTALAPGRSAGSDGEEGGAGETLLASALAELPEDGRTSMAGLALVCVAFDWPVEVRRRFARRLELSAAESALLIEGPESVTAAAAGLAGDPTPSAAHALLARADEELLALVASRGEPARTWVERERQHLRAARLTIDGRDLLAAGVAPGPAVGWALTRTLEARLDGKISAEGELAFALGVVASASREGVR